MAGRRRANDVPERKQRTYTTEDRAACLAALAANGGILAKTAKQCGVPRKTLAEWAKGRSLANDSPPPPPPPKIADVAATAAPAAKAHLSGLFDAFIRRVLDLTTDEDVKKAPLAARFTALGIAFDKRRLLQGEPTEITDATVSHSVAEDLAPYAGAIEGFLAGRGEVPSDDPAQPVAAP
jgi:transposase-like protein